MQFEFPSPGSLRVITWRDPAVENLPSSRATDSDVTSRFWLPILGPTATLMARRFAADSVHGDASWDLDVLAAAFGVRPATAAKAVGRLCQFGVATQVGERLLAVRLVLPPLPCRWRERLPEVLADEYAATVPADVAGDRATAA